MRLLLEWPPRPTTVQRYNTDIARLKGGAIQGGNKGAIKGGIKGASKRGKQGASQGGDKGMMVAVRLDHVTHFNQQSALLLAARNRHFRVVELLVGAGASMCVLGRIDLDSLLFQPPAPASSSSFSSFSSSSSSLERGKLAFRHR